MNKFFRDTATLQRLDAAHHLHRFTHGDETNRKGVLVITRAEGVFLPDPEGNNYLDGMSGLWCVNLGYGRKELARAAAAQIDSLIERAVQALDKTHKKSKSGGLLKAA